MPVSEIPEAQIEKWLILGLIGAISPVRRRAIAGRYGGLDGAVAEGPGRWWRDGLLPRQGGQATFGSASGGTVPETLSSLEDTRDWAARQIREARRRGVMLLPWGTDGYPPLLGVAPDPPPVIYVRGDPSALDLPAVAVVGARRPSRYGRDIARRLGAALAGAGVAVVSGGARGIDSEAHLGALEGGGPTISVMGCGLDMIYPPENAALFGRIAASGILASEYPFGFAPRPQYFPARNRVIAGLGLGVIVVEGREGSGSLITANCALEANREVMAVPGPLGSKLSDGPNRLIAEGAQLVRGLRDVVGALPSWAGVTHPDEEGGERGRPGPELDEESKAVMDLLEPHEGKSADEIGGILGVGPGEVLGRLTALELMGLIDQMPGGRYARRS